MFRIRIYPDQFRGWDLNPYCNNAGTVDQNSSRSSSSWSRQFFFLQKSRKKTIFNMDLGGAYYMILYVQEVLTNSI